jgi:hypothetical protein
MEEEKMIVVILDSCNDCDFALKIDDQYRNKIKDIKEFCLAGLQAWYRSCHEDLTEEDTKYFSKEEIDSFWGCGYAEPSMELLKKNGIEAELTDCEYDEEENELISPCDYCFVYPDLGFDIWNTEEKK